MVCGMPLPWDPGKYFRVMKTISASPSGVISKGRNEEMDIILWNTPFAHSHAIANRIATSPTLNAPLQNTRRRFQSRIRSSSGNGIFIGYSRPPLNSGKFNVDHIIQNSHRKQARFQDKFVAAS